MPPGTSLSRPHAPVLSVQAARPVAECLCTMQMPDDIKEQSRNETKHP